MGAEHKLHYIGVKDKDWTLVHFVELPGGANSASMLRGLQKF
jgi:hypothetical protein